MGTPITRHLITAKMEATTAKVVKAPATEATGLGLGLAEETGGHYQTGGQQNVAGILWPS